MRRLTQNVPMMFSGVVAALVAGVLYASEASAGGDEEASGGGGGKLYTVKDGKVDEGTYNGWRRYEGTCLRCHGPAGGGSSQAPALVGDNGRIKEMPYVAFEATVTNGTQGQVGIMPPFGKDPNVEPYIDDLWSYLNALNDGAIGAAPPEEMGGEKLPEYLRNKK